MNTGLLIHSLTILQSQLPDFDGDRLNLSDSMKRITFRPLFFRLKRANSSVSLFTEIKTHLLLRQSSDLNFSKLHFEISSIHEGIEYRECTVQIWIVTSNVMLNSSFPFYQWGFRLKNTAVFLDKWRKVNKFHEGNIILIIIFNIKESHFTIHCASNWSFTQTVFIFGWINRLQNVYKSRLCWPYRFGR